MSSADATIEMERKIPSRKKRDSLWEVEKYHSFENRDLAERFPAHIGGSKTSILPALPKTMERRMPKIPEDFGTTPYTFGYTDKYPTPSDKKIMREIQIRQMADALVSNLDRMPKDQLMRMVSPDNSTSLELEALERALDDPSGYSLGRLAYPRGFKHLPLPRNKKPWDYYDSLKSGATKLTGWR